MLAWQHRQEKSRAKNEILKKKKWERKKSKSQPKQARRKRRNWSKFHASKASFFRSFKDAYRCAKCVYGSEWKLIHQDCAIDGELSFLSISNVALFRFETSKPENIFISSDEELSSMSCLMPLFAFSFWNLIGNRDFFRWFGSRLKS